MAASEGLAIAIRLTARTSVEQEDRARRAKRARRAGARRAAR
jgi:hypothetical protein